MRLVDLVHHMWRTGDITQELGWKILVLIPKGNTDTRFIGLLETLWKAVEALIGTLPSPACICMASSTVSGTEEGQGWL